MKLASISAKPLAIPFNVAFRHASAERTAMQSLWVEAHTEEGAAGYGEGCPREYVTAENLENAQSFVQQHADLWIELIHDLATLSSWVEHHQSEIDDHPAAWCAVELALLDLIGKEEGQSVERLLGLTELSGHFHYTAVLGDAPPGQFGAQLAHYRKAGFSVFKIKLSGEHERDAAKIAALRSAGVRPEDVRADANNLWRNPDDAIRALAALSYPFFAVEEPLTSGDYAGMAQIGKTLDMRIILDESLLRPEQLDQLPGSPDRWIANVRVSKIGGVLRTLKLVQALRRHRMKMIVGAHVGETSILTRAALTVAHSARDILIAQEGAFGTYLLARDVTEPPLMFGPGGILDVNDYRLQTSGMGLDVRSLA
jgi:L-alanine-DL-glutamate epimerase-like enolase superfamily enzyme